MVPVWDKARRRTPKVPCQRHSNPRSCNPSFFEDPGRVENVKAQTEAAIAAGELIHEVAARKRFKNKKAWAGPGMTWLVQYDKKADCVTHEIIKSEYKSERNTLHLCLKMNLGTTDRVGKTIMRVINGSWTLVLDPT